MKQPIRKLNGRRTPPAARPLRHVVAALIVREENPTDPNSASASAANSNAANASTASASTANSSAPIAQPPFTTANGAHAREIFICQRRPDQPMGLKWEFPGGKVEPGETSVQALARELNEELGITATIGPHVTTIHHTYRNGGAIEIDFFTVREFQGDLNNRIFHQMLWSPLQRLPDYDFLAADHDLIRDLADGKLL